MPAILAGLVRLWLAAALGGLVAKGYLTAEQFEQIVTYVVGIGGIVILAIWSVVSNTLKKMTETIAERPEIKAIVAEPDLANSIPSEKVVPSDDLDLS